MESILRSSGRCITSGSYKDTQKYTYQVSHSLVGVEFLSDTKTKEDKKLSCCFLRNSNKNPTSAISGLGSVWIDDCRNILSEYYLAD